MELGKIPQILCIQLVRFKKYFVSSQQETSKDYSETPTPITGCDTPTPAPTTSQPTQTMVAEKIDTRVNVPTQLDLSALVSHPVKYDLLAVCNHHGSSPNSGHYTALFLLSGAWWYASDEIVREAQVNEFEDITPANSYLLFYEQKENTPPPIIRTTTIAQLWQSYDLALTDEQKQCIINADQALETNAEFDTNRISGLCGLEACKLALDMWCSCLKFPQLLSVKDFMSQVQVCSTCIPARGWNRTRILQSLSKYNGLDGLDSKKHTVKLYIVLPKLKN